jgi:hypothetical protein
MFRTHLFTRQPIKLFRSYGRLTEIVFHSFRERRLLQAHSDMSHLFTVLFVLLSAGWLVACTDTTSALPDPAGAAKGQNTFLLFYTDN